MRRAVCRWRPATLVLAYHHVGDARQTAPWITVSAERFAEQIEFLAASGLVLPLDRLLADLREGRVPSGGHVVVTFDDAMRDTFDTAFPILRRYGVPATVFVPTGLVGRRGVFWWNRLARLEGTAAARGLSLGDFFTRAGVPESGRRRGDSLWRRLRLCDESQRHSALEGAAAWLKEDAADETGTMGWEELAQLDASGLITLGAHTVTHPLLASLSEEQLRSEVVGSRDALSRFRAFRPVFAYPYGDEAAIGPAAKRVVREAGFEAAFTTEETALSGREEHMALGRVCIDEMETAAFRWLVDHHLGF